MAQRFVALCALILAGAALGGCSTTASVPNPHAGAMRRSTGSTSTTPIQHVVLIVQENRTFNDFFATYPGADGTTTGKVAADPACQIYTNGTVQLQEVGLIDSVDFNHAWQGYNIARDGGNMDGFDKIPRAGDVPECLYPYQYVNPSDIAPYWDLAQQYVLAEHMFTVQGSSSFTGHQDLIAGGTIVAPNEAMVNLPSCSGGNCRWGCDAPAGTHTSLISRKDVYKPAAGPYPCDDKFSVKYPTMRDLLDAKDVSWKYYVPSPCCNTNGKLFTAFDIVHAVRYGPEWKTNISYPETNIFKDISKNALPAVSWVIPDEPDSDHPGEPKDDGPEWVASVVNAIGESPYWNSTAIVIVWDDWGGLYDNLNPPQKGYGGDGMRVPAIIVSPYAKPGYISTTNYDFGSILRYIEDNWNLGTLGGSDKNANSIIDSFDYTQPPIEFQPIPSSLSKSYFIHRKPSGLPIDDDM